VALSSPARRLLIGSRDLPAFEEQLKRHKDVLVTSDPSELVEGAFSRHFDLVLVSTDMVEISGFELMKKLQSSFERVPVVFCSVDRVHVLARTIASMQSMIATDWEPIVAELLAPRATPQATTSETTDDDEIRKRVLEASFREREQLLARSLSTSEVAQLLKVSRQTPHDRASQKTLLAIQDKNQLRFPPWQFDANGANGVVAGLPEVLQALAIGPLSQARWLTTPKRVFENRSPLELLKSGEIDRVVREARGVGATAG
jgi:DNA-binding NarL/FixJ family response regulator